MPCWWLCKASSFQPRDQVVMSTTASRLPLLPWQTFPSTRLYAGFAGIACVAAAMLHADLLLRPPLKIMSQTWLAQQLSLLAAHSQQQPSSCLAHPYVARAAAAVVHVAALAVGTPFIAAAPCAAWFVSVIYRHCRRSSTDSGDGGDCTRFLRFRDPRVHERMKGKRIPIEDMYEMYFDGKLDLLQPGGGACLLKDVLSRRHEFVRYTFSLTGHLPFLLFRWIPDVLLGHSQRGDTAQVRDHYDRGTILVHENPLSGGAAEDDFFGMFLGDTMIYTAGIAARLEEEQTLEEMQRNKLALVCSKLRLKPGDRHLDIGCGWGTLVQYAAAVHGASSTGVTLSRNQAQFAAARAKAMGLDDQTQARYLCMDYRDIPRHPAAAAATRYDKISCLEMAEHVGVKNFHSFLGQVRDTLNDDGIFFLQIAGLRRPFQVGLLAASQYDCTQSHTHLHLSSDIPLSILSVPSGSIYKEMPRKRSISISNASILNHSGDSSCPSGAHRRLTQQHSHGHPLHSEHVLPIHVYPCAFQCASKNESLIDPFCILCKVRGPGLGPLHGQVHLPRRRRVHAPRVGRGPARARRVRGRASRQRRRPLLPHHPQVVPELGRQQGPRHLPLRAAVVPHL